MSYGLNNYFEDNGTLYLLLLFSYNFFYFKEEKSWKENNAAELQSRLIGQLQ